MQPDETISAAAIINKATQTENIVAYLNEISRKEEPHVTEDLFYCGKGTTERNNVLRRAGAFERTWHDAYGRRKKLLPPHGLVVSVGERIEQRRQDNNNKRYN